jgi:hypothetical protein
VARAAQHGVQRIAERTFGRDAVQGRCADRAVTKKLESTSGSLVMKNA